MLRNRSRAVPVTSQQALMADHTSQSSSSPLMSDHTSQSSSSPLMADHTSQSSSSPSMADHTSRSSSSPSMADHTSRSSSSPSMADHTSRSSSSPQNNFTTQIHSFFHSPRFKAFIPTNLTEITEAMKSPTSILYNKSFLPFGYDYINNPKSPNIISQNNKQHSPVENLEPKGIALVIVDTLKDKPKLRVQIPLLTPSLISPNFPGDFGIKARNLHLSSSAFSSPKSGFHMKDSPRVINGSVPVNEMELSEDYTCVISHGPNPKTTHIFDDCIVDCCCSVSNDKPKSAAESFLSFCHTCKKRLEQKVDIYIYRGDKAFCSQECRYQEIILDEEANKEFH